MKAIWTGAALLVAALTPAACGSEATSVCGQACERLHGCGLSAIHLTSVKMYTFGDDCSAAPCDGAAECIAQCFNAASGGELQTVVSGGAL